MTVTELLTQLTQNNVTLSIKGTELAVHGKKQALAPALLTLLREHKTALVALISSGQYAGPKHAVLAVPPNLIPAGCDVITPDMLPLVRLTLDEIERIVDGVPGGAANIQDIYPLAPLQEGVLFHHLMATTGDPYLLHGLYTFDSRARLDLFIGAMQAVIDRHDILRTAILWDGLPEPVQVVLRQAQLAVEEVTVDHVAGNVAEQLRSRFNPRHYRIDVRQAPLMRLCIAQDAGSGRWAVLHLFHHLAVDHTTAEIMRHEIEVCMAGQARQLPLALPFRNFVAQARLGVSREEHEAFFRKMLSDVDQPTAPFDVTAVTEDGSSIREDWLELDARLAQRLRDSARLLGVSMASLCHLAWAMVLARVSGRDDVVFGTVLVGRMQGGEGADRVLGMFINTLPLRIRIGEATAQDGVQQTHMLLAQLLRHEHAPLMLAQRCSGVAAPTPLFTTFLNYRFNAHVAHAGDTGDDTALEASRIDSGIEFLGAQERTNYPLCLNVDDLGDGLSLNVQAQAPIDPTRVCSYMHTALERLADALESRSGTALRELDILPAYERRQLLTGWNATRTSHPNDRCMHELFEARAAATPDAIALLHEGRTISYGDLNAQANRLAHHLRTLGVQPDARVGLCLERSIDMVIALLATLKAGGAYVPLDPGHPSERLAAMLADSTPCVVLTHERIPAQAHATLRLALAASGAALVDLDDDAHSRRWARQPASNPQRSDTGLTPQNLCYLIYTSGSTGVPKGVMIQHDGLANYLHWAQRTYRPDRGAIVSSSLSFDATVTSLLTPLIHGSRVHLLGEQREIDELEQQVQAQDSCGLVKITPAHLDALGQRLLAEQRRSHVDAFIIGGEALSPATVSLWQRIQPGVRLINEYGPTETVVGCIVHDIAPRTGQDTPEDATAPVPIGRPIANTRIYLLDAHKRPVPIGAIGEIYIGGAGVARGYLNRPALTAERFLADPFVQDGQDNQARLYKSGDLGRYGPDGVIEFLGRNDHQVKIRGYRIEPGEIESLLQQHPAIRDAAVIAREDQPGDKRLVAYYTVKDGPIDAAVLQAHLAAQLPDYMIPSAWMALDALPLTSNGKLDRAALPAPDGTGLAADRYEAPEGGIETALAAIWAEVLKLERVGRQDNFFRLGGHSLLAVKVASRMRDRQLHVDVRTLFTTPTLAALAAMVGNDGDTVAVPENRIPQGCTAISPDMLPLVQLTAADIAHIVGTVPGGAANVQDIYPLAPLQEGILFHRLMADEGDVYLTAGTFSFDTRLQLDHFLQALQAVIDRHDILRTAVLWDKLPESVQVVWRKAPLTVEEISLDPAAGDIGAQLLQRFDPRHYRIDVRQAPLMRTGVAHDAENGRWVMLYLFHHLAVDHTTLDVMLQEIQAHLLGRTAQLPAPLPFRNFVAQARLGVPREEHEAFFRKMLGDVDEPTAPFGLVDVQGDGSGMAAAWRDVDAPLARRLRRQARSRGVSAACLCHLAWATVLARVSGRDDVVFGTVLFGRMQGGEGAERVLGMFMNTLPIRVRIGDASVQDSVSDTHMLLTQLMRHEHAPLALAQRCSAVAAPAPLFASFLNYRHIDDGGQASPDHAQAWEGVRLLKSEERSNYPFCLNINDMGEALVLNAHVQAPIDPSRICTYMHNALEQLADALEQAPATTPMRSLDILWDPLESTCRHASLSIL